MWACRWVVRSMLLINHAHCLSCKPRLLWETVTHKVMFYMHILLALLVLLLLRVAQSAWIILAMNGSNWFIYLSYHACSNASIVHQELMPKANLQVATLINCWYPSFSCKVETHSLLRSWHQKLLRKCNSQLANISIESHRKVPRVSILRNQ